MNGGEVSGAFVSVPPPPPPFPSSVLRASSSLSSSLSSLAEALSLPPLLPPVLFDSLPLPPALAKTVNELWTTRVRIVTELYRMSGEEIRGLREGAGRYCGECERVEGVVEGMVAEARGEAKGEARGSAAATFAAATSGTAVEPAEPPTAADLEPPFASGDDEPKKPAPSHWWSSLTAEDPLTLDPLSSLPHPPFLLPSRHHFSPLPLALYITSRAVFSHPLTRASLTAADCRALDEHIAEHCTSNLPGSPPLPPSVLSAFNVHRSVRVSPGSEHLRSSAAMAASALFSGWGGANSENATEGLRIVDDAEAVGEAADEAADEAAERGEYEEAAEDFPALAPGTLLPVAPAAALSGLKGVVESAAAAAEREEMLLAVAREVERERASREKSARRVERERARKARGARIGEEREAERAGEELEREGRREIVEWRRRAFDGAARRTEEEREAAREEKMERGREAEEERRGAEEARREEEERHKEEERRARAGEEVAKEERERLKKAKKKEKEKERVKAKKAAKAALASAASSEARAAEERRTAASRCAACNEGIVENADAFRKEGRVFCTSKCARSGPSL